MNLFKEYEQGLPAVRRFHRAYANPRHKRALAASPCPEWRLYRRPETASRVIHAAPMPVLVLAGAWCGDCINQCPIHEHFAAVAPVIQLRYLDRDAHRRGAGRAANLRRQACAGPGLFCRGWLGSRPLRRAHVEQIPAAHARSSRPDLPHGHRRVRRPAPRPGHAGLAQRIRARAMALAAIAPLAAKAWRLIFFED